LIDPQVTSGKAGKPAFPVFAVIPAQAGIDVGKITKRAEINPAKAMRTPLLPVIPVGGDPWRKITKRDEMKPERQQCRLKACETLRGMDPRFRGDDGKEQQRVAGSRLPRG
jgi:hypothetical protein